MSGIDRWLDRLELVWQRPTPPARPTSARGFSLLTLEDQFDLDTLLSAIDRGPGAKPDQAALDDARLDRMVALLRKAEGLPPEREGVVAGTGGGA